jgi:hypothetical protein
VGLWTSDGPYPVSGSGICCLGCFLWYVDLKQSRALYIGHRPEQNSSQRRADLSQSEARIDAPVALEASITPIELIENPNHGEVHQDNDGSCWFELLLTLEQPESDSSSQPIE